MRILGKNIYAFDDEGVVVRVLDPTLNIIPRKRELEWDPAMWHQDNFRPMRLVMNLDLFDPIYEKAVVREVSIKIQIYYTPSEKAAIEPTTKIPVAYWKNGQWFVIPEEQVKDRYPVLSQGWAGYLQFKITTLGDPTIALGS